MKIPRHFTREGQDVLKSVEYENRTSRITNPDGTVVFEMKDAMIPRDWSQLAADIMVSKYFRKAGVPQTDPKTGKPLLDEKGHPVLGPEKSAAQVVHRLAGCWRHWGETHGYFDTPKDAQAFYDEIAFMLLKQMCAPNSPQWFNTGLNWAYNISGPAQGHYYCDPKTGEMKKSADAYTHPQPHACQPYHSLVSTPKGPVPIGMLVDFDAKGAEVFDGSKEGTGLTRIVATSPNGEKGVFKILLKNGASVEATGDHLVYALTERRGEGAWRRVDELSAGDRLLLSTRTSVTEKSNPQEVLECALAGWLQGDGFVGQYKEGTNQSLTLEFITIDEDEFQFVIERIEKVFAGVHYKVRAVESENPELDIRRIRLYGEKLRPFVEQYGLLREDSDHQIPDQIFASGLEAQAAYIQALFQTDGTVRRRVRDTKTADVVFTTTSEPLATDLQSLLLNLGIYSRVQRGVEKRTDRKTPWFVSIGYADARKRFENLIGFISTTKKNKLASACSDEFPGKQLPALREEIITRIEWMGVQPVYDIQTESGQYLSNNIIVHNCFIQSVSDDLVNEGGIMDLWVREARLFKYGSGTGTNFSKLRGENEPLSGGGKSSGLMSFLKIGDRAAGAIKSGGTTRRAAKMVCLDLDHPDIEAFVNWKVREELKVACLAEGIKHLPKDQQALAQRLNLKLDYDFNGEAYQTVSGQNSNNSVRIPNAFFKAVEADGDWSLIARSAKDKKTGKNKTHKTLKARTLWDQIAFAAWRCADPGVQFDDTINQWHTCPKSGRINASNPCVTGDTRVLTPGGVWRRIDRMIHLPGRILTNLDGMRVGVTEGAFPTGVKEVFELQTASGYTLKLTADHKVFTANRGWVEAGQLNDNDLLKLPSQPACVGEIGQPRDSAFFQLLGLLVSRANGDLSSIHLDMSLKDSQSLETLSKYVSDNWAALQNYEDDYANPAMLGHSDTLTLHVTQRRLLTRLHAFIVRGLGASTRIGDELFSAGLAAQKQFLRALFTADGALRNHSLEITGESSLLADVQTLLLGFGILSSRRSIHSGARLADDSTPATLRIDPGSLRDFSRHIGLLPGAKASRLASAVAFAISSDSSRGHFDRFHSLAPLGAQPVFDLTEPASHSFIAQGLTIHNCSEYMFLDDTACNLASLNAMMFFDAESRRFNINAWRHATRLWTIVLEISVLMASFPSESIARLSYQFRTLGLGYANLGAMLMQAGIPYDSEKGRAICAALTSILTGECYATSAELAKELGPFPRYAENREEMLRVIRNHRRAAYDVATDVNHRNQLGDYEALDIAPIGIDASQFADSDPLASEALLASARECWDRAQTLGEKLGYRNAQVSVIAPTGTIGLLMDCDTTGVEPDYALVKFKKLAGGGYFKIANQSLKPALKNLGYSSTQIVDILNYVMGTLSLDNAPHVNRVRLGALGFSPDDLDRIEQALPGAFELSFAFSPWALGEETMKSLGIPETQWKTPGFNLLKKLGFTKRQIDEANDYICGRGTIEGAPHLRDEHLPVFDCANKCGKIGKRFIHADGHIRMMAAAQPFITGAISKTINLPNEATVDDIKNSYVLSWKLGLKANALYRDGSKLSQPLNVKSDEDLDNAEEDDVENVESARQALATDVAKATTQVVKMTSDNLATPAPATTIEKIIERIVERPLRRRLPDTRNAKTHKFDVQGHEGYITVGLYDDGNPGEVFITMAKEGSTIGGLMDTIATLVSVSLQYGVPVESLVRKFEHVRFEPSGMTRNPDIPIAKSLVDYIFRWLAMEFIPGYRQANSPRKPEKKSEPAITLAAAPAASAPVVQTPAVAETPANAPADESIRRPHAHGQDAPVEDSLLRVQTKVDVSNTATRLQQVIVPDPLSSQSSSMQADAPACDVCGSITVRSGTCYKCLNCGNSMGCS